MSVHWHLPQTFLLQKFGYTVLNQISYIGPTYGKIKLYLQQAAFLRVFSENHRSTNFINLFQMLKCRRQDWVLARQPRDAPSGLRQEGRAQLGTLAGASQPEARRRRAPSPHRDRAQALGEDTAQDPKLKASEKDNRTWRVCSRSEAYAFTFNSPSKSNTPTGLLTLRRQNEVWKRHLGQIWTPPFTDGSPQHPGLSFHIPEMGPSPHLLSCGGSV